MADLPLTENSRERGAIDKTVDSIPGKRVSAIGNGSLNNLS